MTYMPLPEERNEDELEKSLISNDDRVLHDLERDILANESELDYDEIEVVEDFEHDLPRMD